MAYEPTNEDLRAAYRGMWRTRLAGIDFDRVLATPILRRCLINRAKALRARVERTAGRKLPIQPDLLERAPC